MSNDDPAAESGTAMKHWQECALPECRTEVPTSKGICDDCAGVTGRV